MEILKMKFAGCGKTILFPLGDSWNSLTVSIYEYEIRYGSFSRGIALMGNPSSNYHRKLVNNMRLPVINMTSNVVEKN